jgi:hypothetical protein
MKHISALLLLVLCSVFSSERADARHRGNCCSCYCPAPVCCVPCVMDGAYLDQTRAIWYRYDAQEYYDGYWHPAGYFQHPVYAVVENNRANWLAGGSNRWASSIYDVNVRLGTGSYGIARISYAKFYDLLDIEIQGEGFSLDNDIRDVCSYGVDGAGHETSVEFAQQLYSVQDFRYTCKLVHGSNYARVYVAVRGSDGDWSPWYLASR